MKFNPEEIKRIEKWRTFKYLAKSFPKKYKIEIENDSHEFNGSKVGVLYRWVKRPYADLIEFQGGVVCRNGGPGWSYVDKTTTY